MKFSHNGTIFHRIVSNTKLPVFQASALDHMTHFEIWLDFAGQFGIYKQLMFLNLKSFSEVLQELSLPYSIDYWNCVA